MDQSFQTHFVTSFSPAHRGDQHFMHQDVHHHLANPLGDLLRPPIASDTHRLLWGQTRLPDFGLQQFPGLY